MCMEIAYDKAIVGQKQPAVGPAVDLLPVSVPGTGCIRMMSRMNTYGAAAQT